MANHENDPRLGEDIPGSWHLKPWPVQITRYDSGVLDVHFGDGFSVHVTVEDLKGLCNPADETARDEARKLGFEV